ncbi:MAG TPA: class I SAM-dependent methyltransferase [Longimicrobiales bacterium]
MSVPYEMAPCPACSTTSATVIATREEVRDELEQLWSFQTRRLHGNTPADRLYDRVAFSQDPPLRLVRCDACGLLYRNPRERPAALIETYRDDAPTEPAMRALFENQRRSYRTQVRRLVALAGTGAGLEVGSYVGAFLDAARDSGWDFRGVDVNETANRFARERGLRVQRGSIEDSADDGSFDAVVFWNCFDQLPDPRAAALVARTRLRRGGWIAVRVPSGAFYAAWRARLRSPMRPLARALLAHNNLLGFPYRHGFSLHSLTQLLERAGFRIDRVFGDTLVPTADRWTRTWARLEQRALKTALRPLPARRAPWLELYGRAP